LAGLDAELERLGADLWLARANAPLRQLLTATGLTTRLGAEHIYPSVRAAVTAYRAQFGTT
jgi:sulfate permease, SulP family